MRAPQLQNVSPDLVCSFVICIIEVSSTTQLYRPPTYPLQGIDGVDWVIDYVIFLHIQCEALAIYICMCYLHMLQIQLLHVPLTVHITSGRVLHKHLITSSQLTSKCVHKSSLFL